MSEQLFMPHSQRIDWKEGSQITITGNTIKPLPGRHNWTFCISLCSDPYFGGNIPFHFCADFCHKQKICLKSMSNGTWVKENLVNKPFPFDGAGEKATVSIHFTDDSFQMSVNNEFFTGYTAHAAEEKVNYLYIHGDAFALHSVILTPPRA